MSRKILLRALQLKDLGRHTEAISLFKELISNEAIALQAWEGIANCQIELENLSKAEEAINNALELEPEYSSLKSTLAYIKLDQGKLKQSKIILKDILAEDPTDFRARYLLGQVYISDNKLDQAYSIVQSLENDFPNNHDVKALTIRYHAYKEDYTSFNNDIDILLNENPEDIYALGLKAYYHLENNEFDIAEEVAIQILQINPMDETAKEVLLSCRQNSNALLRFFVGKSFDTYTMEWTWKRVLIFILCIKGVLLWGGFFIIYMLITWIGGVLYNSYLRINLRDRLLLTKNQIQQSNFLLFSITLYIILRVLWKINLSVFSAKASLLLIPIMFIGVSYFQLESPRKKIHFGISTLIMGFILFKGFAGHPDLFTQLVTVTFVILLHGVLFTLRAIGE